MPQSFLLSLLGGALAGFAIFATSFFFYARHQRRRASGLVHSATTEAQRLIADAEKSAETVRSQAVLSGKVEVMQLRQDLEQETETIRKELREATRRAEEQSRDIKQRAQSIETREGGLVSREKSVEKRLRQLEGREAEIEHLVLEHRRKVEEVAGLSAEDARRELMRQVEDEARSQAAALVRDIKEQARRSAERDAKRIVAMSIQRIAAEYTAESTVSAVTLPNDEMKGRIIGREGRNIRAFETTAGVDVIIDDTPDTVVISCFNPIRREIARRSLEALIADGRIHPGRIEEIVARVEAELDTELVELGEQAAYETGIHGLHPELIKLIGRMRYRTSFGQNILEHSKEVAWLAGMMGAELHCDVLLAKRGALLHDVGKVLTHDSEGTHVELGVEVARKYGESDAVINCIQAHHDDVPHESTESVLVQAADAISGSRPGARREAFETYVKRLTRLEEIATGFDGVEKCNAIQAGREIRVVVHPERIDDTRAAELSDAIARKVESELQYPGQIRVVVIRETRAVDFAR